MDADERTPLQQSPTVSEDEPCLENPLVVELRRLEDEASKGSLLARFQVIDLRVSALIFRWSPNKFMEGILAIGCLLFSMFGLLLWVPLWLLFVPHPFAFKDSSFVYPITVGVCWASYALIKALTQRERPKREFLGGRGLQLDFEHVDANHSCPSGDTAQAVVFVVVFWSEVSSHGGSALSTDYWADLALLLVPMWVALGRVYFGRHHVGDTILGASLGAAVSVATLAVIGKW